MRLIFHGILRQRFGREAVMAVNSVGEAIEGFSRQTDWPNDLVVRVVGFDTPEQFKDFAEEVHIMPALRGGGGKFGSILLGAAVVGVGLIAGGAWLIPLVVSGGLMIAQGVIGLFMKSPTIKGTDDPEASKYLPVNRNTTSIGTPITMAWGRIDLAGQWLSLQSDSTNLSYGSFPASPS